MFGDENQKMDDSTWRIAAEATHARGMEFSVYT